MKPRSMKRNIMLALILTLAMVLQSGILVFAGDLEEIPGADLNIETVDSMADELVSPSGDENVLAEDLLSGTAVSDEGIFDMGSSSGNEFEEGDTVSTDGSVDNVYSEDKMSRSANGSDMGVSLGNPSKLKVKRGKLKYVKTRKESYRYYIYSWKAAKNATGYQFQESTDSKFKQIWCNKYTTNLSEKDAWNKPTDGRKLYFRVRAFRISGTKVYYGRWVKSSYTFRY